MICGAKCGTGADVHTIKNLSTLEVVPNVALEQMSVIYYKPVKVIWGAKFDPGRDINRLKQIYPLVLQKKEIVHEESKQMMN